VITFPARPHSAPVQKVSSDAWWRALHRIADTLEPDVRNAFLKAVRFVQAKVDVQNIVDALLVSGATAVSLRALWQALESELDSALRAPLREAVLGGASVADRRLPLGSMRFDLTNPAAVQAVDSEVANLVREITLESQTAIRDLVRLSVQGTFDVRQLARQIRGSIGLTSRYATAVERYRQRLVDGGMREGRANLRAQAYADRLLRHRAEAIARTEVIRATSAGQQAVWSDAQREGLLPFDAKRVWIVTPDDRLCELCAPMEDQTVGLNEPFHSADVGAVNYPPLHPQCLPGYTLVTSREQISAQSKRWYEGELVVIRTAGGKQLSTTPNHPVLTNCGWVAAGTLDESHNLVRDSFFERVASGNDYDGLMPTRVEQIADTFGQSGQMTPREVPVAPEDFHGDGEGSQVAVIRTNGLLRNDAYTAFAEPFVESPFVDRNDFPALLDGEGLGAFSLPSLPNTTDSIMRGSRLADPLLGSHMPPFDAFGITLRAERDAALTKADINNASGNVVTFGELIRRYPGEIILDQIVQVDRVDFSGHVYSMETGNGIYIAEGIVVHNCRCAIGIAPEES